MESWFDIYWRFLGLPLSSLKGLFVDMLPFSLVEAATWCGIVSSLLLLLTPFSRAMRQKSRLWLLLIFIGPVMLITMAGGQGAFSWSLSPSAWRAPLADLDGEKGLDFDEFEHQVRLAERELNRLYSSHGYGSLSEEEVLSSCDRGMDRLLVSLGFPPGRQVRRAKTMGPLNSLLGLSYGGPAFHDPLWAEIAIIDSNKLPTTKAWRLKAMCHEVAHAKGFMREVDAEILAYLTLMSSEDSREQLLGHWMFLNKSGMPHHMPPPLVEESRLARDARIRVREGQPLVRWMRSLMRLAEIQNEPGKYGTRHSNESWDTRHPFYASVSHLSKKLADGR